MNRSVIDWATRTKGWSELRALIRPCPLSGDKLPWMQTDRRSQLAMKIDPKS
jgi:hypothetical protein